MYSFNIQGHFAISRRIVFLSDMCETALSFAAYYSDRGTKILLQIPSCMLILVKCEINEA